MVIFTLVEVVICIISIDRLTRSDLKADDTSVLSRKTEEDEIDSGIIEVVLFAQPFMLVTNILVMLAIARDNVWLLLPWMVLHCVVIAFLTLGAAILSVHSKYILGMASLFR